MKCTCYTVLSLTLFSSTAQGSTSLLRGRNLATFDLTVLSKLVESMGTFLDATSLSPVEPSAPSMGQSRTPGRRVPAMRPSTSEKAGTVIPSDPALSGAGSQPPQDAPQSSSDTRDIASSAPMNSGSVTTAPAASVFLSGSATDPVVPTIPLPKRPKATPTLPVIASPEAVTASPILDRFFDGFSDKPPPPTSEPTISPAPSASVFPTDTTQPSPSPSDVPSGSPSTTTKPSMLPSNVASVSPSVSHTPTIDKSSSPTESPAPSPSPSTSPSTSTPSQSSAPSDPVTAAPVKSAAPVTKSPITPAPVTVAPSSSAPVASASREIPFIPDTAPPVTPLQCPNSYSLMIAQQVIGSDDVIACVTNEDCAGFDTKADAAPCCLHPHCLCGSANTDRPGVQCVAPL